MNPIAVRLLNQQLAAPQFSDPAEVVSYMGAMQAQEYRMMRWAVEMRTRKRDADAQAIGKGIQTGFRQRADYPSAPDAGHVATSGCRGLLDDDWPLCAQGHRRDEGLDEQQQNQYS